jgi:hypothetical protein
MENLKVGLIFKSIYMPDTTCKVLHINEHKNEIDVELTKPMAFEKDSVWEEVWNLKVTIWAFEKNEYVVISN